MNNSSDILIPGMIALIIWGVILYTIIRNASKSDLQMKYNRINMLLLTETAKKLGVEPEKINQIYDDGKKSK